MSAAAVTMLDKGDESKHGSVSPDAGRPTNHGTPSSNRTTIGGVGKLHFGDSASLRSAEFTNHNIDRFNSPIRDTFSPQPVSSTPQSTRSIPPTRPGSGPPSTRSMPLSTTISAPADPSTNSNSPPSTMTMGNPQESTTHPPPSNGSVPHAQQPRSAARRNYSNSRTAEYIVAPGEDDSKRPLLPKSSSRSRALAPGAKKEPVVLKDMNELRQHLELMHDRCIARNLRAAGLGGFEVDDEVIYGVLDPNAHMASGESMIVATILYLKEPDRLHHYVSILLNDGADVNERDKDGRTALMHAILNGRDKAAKAILRHERTDPLTRDNEGNTALMHAASIGSERMLYYFFKTLRKREKQHFQKQHLKKDKTDDDLTSKTSTTTQSSAATVTNSNSNRKYTKSASIERQRENSISKSTTNTDSTVNNSDNLENRTNSTDAGELWSLMRSDDPLDLQNARNETAHVVALKNGHMECANMISDEKLRRAKEMNKRLNALNHHRSGSPSILRFAKRSAKKYFQHYGSFDSLYFDREDESDDELMLANSTSVGMPRSRTAEAIKTGELRLGSRPASPQQTQQPKRHHTNKGFLVRLNKRFQSNPDLFRVKASASHHGGISTITNAGGHDGEIGGERISPGRIGGGEAIDGGRSIGANGNEQPATMEVLEKAREIEEKMHRAAAKLDSGGSSGALKRGTEQAPPSTQTHHRPVIKGSYHLHQYQHQSTVAQQQHPPQTHQNSGSRRSSGSVFGQSHKRNLAEKLMNFFRVRPKYTAAPVPTSVSDATLSASSSGIAREQHKRRVSKKFSQPQYPNFDSIERTMAADDEGGNNSNMNNTNLRKGFSQPDISPTEEKTAGVITGGAGLDVLRRSSGPVATPAPPPPAPVASGGTPVDQRRSLDLSSAIFEETNRQPTRNNPASKYAMEWPGDDEEAGGVIDDSMISMTDSPPDSASPRGATDPGGLLKSAAIELEFSSLPI